MNAMTRNITNILKLFGALAPSVTTTLWDIIQKDFTNIRKVNAHKLRFLKFQLMLCSEFVNCASGNDDESGNSTWAYT